MRSWNIPTKTISLILLGSIVFAQAARAAPFNDLFIFGDSYSDTGSYFPGTNGLTAVGYLANYLGVTLTTSKNAHPGTNGVNFAESGARVAAGPTPPAANPRSLTQQVGEFQNDVNTGALTFNPASTLFFLAGGLNDHTTPASSITGAYMVQVGQLYAAGARHIEIALLPALSPAFADSAANLNPAYRALVPQLQAEFPNAEITLSNWGSFFESVLRNASQYGFSNTSADGCFSYTTNTQTCASPGSYYFYYPNHPSTAVHRIVGAALYQEALTTMPEPTTLALLGSGVAFLAWSRSASRTKSSTSGRDNRNAGAS